MNKRNYRLIEARLSKGLLQKEMAKLLGMCMTSYMHRETGKLEFKESEMRQCCKILGKSMDYLFGRDENGN